MVKIICAIIFIIFNVNFGFNVNAAVRNCTNTEHDSIEKCENSHPLNYAENITNTVSSVPLFANYLQRRVQFDGFCKSLDKQIKCLNKIDPPNHECFADYFEGKQSLHLYICDMLHPIVAEKTLEVCWNKTASCRLPVEKETQTATDRNKVCNFFEAAELQINCALNQQQDACKALSSDALRRARSETSNILDSFQCLENIEENLSQNKDEVVVVTQPPKTLKIPATSPAESNTGHKLCSADQNREGLVCLSELWGLDKYMDPLKNGKLWKAMTENDTTWQNICTQMSGYQTCMSGIPGTKNGRCQFKTLLHSYASLLNLLCTHSHMIGVHTYSHCLEHATSETASSYNQCTKLFDDMISDMGLIQSKNQLPALCDAFSSPVESFDCFMKIFNPKCKPVVEGLQFFISAVTHEAVIDGCDNVNETVGSGENHESSEEVSSASHVEVLATARPRPTPTQLGPNVGHMPSIQPTVVRKNESEEESTEEASHEIITSRTKLEHHSTANLANIETDVLFETSTNKSTSVEEVTEPADLCASINSQQCTGDSSFYGFNPITLVTDKSKLLALCSIRKNIDHCIPKFTCKSLIYAKGIIIAIDFACHQGTETYLSANPCLREANQMKPVQACVSTFESSDTTKGCENLNSLLRCTFPLIFDKCGKNVAEFHLNSLHVIAMGSNASCILDSPTPVQQAGNGSAQATPTPALMNETILAHAVNCTDQEETQVGECVKPFQVVVDRIQALTTGGLSTLIKGLNNITNIFHEGCALRDGFENCVKTKIGYNTECRISSCLIKIGETECKEDPSSRSIETKIRCMFTLVADPAFKECMKIVPKDAFSHFEKLRLVLPNLIECMRVPILTKCGEDSWRLVSSLGSSAKPNFIDPTCTLSVNVINGTQPVAIKIKENELGDNKDNTTVAIIINEKVIPTETNITSEHKLAKNQSVDSQIDNVHVNEVFAEMKTSTSPIMVMHPIQTTTQAVAKASAASTIQSPKNLKDSNASFVVCSTEMLDQFEDCGNVLGDLKPLPITFWDATGKIDKACPLYNKYSTCLQKYPCRYPLGEAYKAMLNKLCTDYYDTYKNYDSCLRLSLFNRKMQTCIGSFQASNLRSYASDLNDRACKTVGDLLKCVGDIIDFQCIDEAALNFLIGVYNSFAHEFKPDCVFKREDIGAPMKSCSWDERAAYFECRRQVAINPISLVNDTHDFSSLCEHFGTTFQTCIHNVSCIPQPAHEAFNDTLSEVCFPATLPSDFSQHAECLISVGTSKSAQQCLKAFDEISFDDPGKMVCRKINSVLDCAVPLIVDKCNSDSLVYIYNIMSRFMVRYRVGCVLNVPQISTTRNPNVTALYKFATQADNHTVKVEATTMGLASREMYHKMWWLTSISVLITTYFYSKI